MADSWAHGDDGGDGAFFAPFDGGVAFSEVLPPERVWSLARSTFADWAWALLRTAPVDGDPGWCTRASEHCQPAELLGVLTRHYRSMLGASVAAWIPDGSDVDADPGSLFAHDRELVPVEQLVGDLTTTPLDGVEAPDASILVLKVILSDGQESDGFRVLGEITDEELIGALAVQIELLQVQLVDDEKARPI